MEVYPCAPWGGGRGQHFKEVVAEVATVELFCFCAFVKVLIMHSYLSLDVSSNFEYLFKLFQFVCTGAS